MRFNKKVVIAPLFCEFFHFIQIEINVMAYTEVFVFSKWVEFQGFLLSCLSGSFGCFFKLKKYFRRGALLDILCQGKLYLIP